MEPVMEQIGEMLEGKVKIVQLDIDSNEKTANAERVTGTPTFILYRDGRAVWREAGEMPADACEPDYASHHFTEVADRAKKWVLIAACAALFAYLFISNRLYSHVSTVLLIFPQYINLLALCNLICLPFSFWSVWYQKIRAHAWCTLCLCVQSMLWLLFFCYLFGGWLHGLLPLLDRQNVSQP